jgi:hypothetical protein
VGTDSGTGPMPRHSGGTRREQKPYPAYRRRAGPARPLLIWSRRLSGPAMRAAVARAVRAVVKSAAGPPRARLGVRGGSVRWRAPRVTAHPAAGSRRGQQRSGSARPRPAVARPRLGAPPVALVPAAGAVGWRAPRTTARPGAGAAPVGRSESARAEGPAMAGPTVPSTAWSPPRAGGSAPAGLARDGGPAASDQAQRWRSGSGLGIDRSAPPGGRQRRGRRRSVRSPLRELPAVRAGMRGGAAWSWARRRAVRPRRVWAGRLRPADRPGLEWRLGPQAGPARAGPRSPFRPARAEAAAPPAATGWEGTAGPRRAASA